MNDSIAPSPRRAPSSRGRARPDSPEVQLARLAKALGHPVRVTIMKLLIARGECVCGAIVDELPLAQATVSQHLKVLKQAGLVQGEIDGPRVCYCVNPAAVRRLESLVAGLSGRATPPKGSQP